MRPSLELIYMELAHQIARRSTCKRLQVGCVISSQNLEHIYSVGYNGTAKGLPNDECRVEDTGNCGDIHAEINAMVKVGVRDSHKIFFLTVNPCETCAKLIVNSGAWKVYIAGEYRIPTGNKILAQSGIGVEMMYAKDLYIRHGEWIRESVVNFGDWENDDERN